MTHTPNLSCIICTYNRADYLAETLQFLVKNNCTGHVEILIVDNNSTDATRQTADQYIDKSAKGPVIRYITEKKQGLSFARNRGIREAHAPVLLFLDDDIRVEEDFLESWLSFFKKHPSVLAAGGRIDVQFDDPRPRWLSSYLLPLLGYHNHGYDIKPYPRKSYPFGGNMGIRKEMFDRFGMFDTELGRIGKKLTASEEKEFFNRLKEASVPLMYVPNAMIWHRVNQRRLTKEYIRRQAIGLGQSLAIQVQSRPFSEQFKTIATESAKWCASVMLFLYYTVTFRFSKGWMLIRFRKWIADGFYSYQSNQQS